ncbi:WD40 repeat domain-containing protein [Glycomyces harbinensis]|uniref:WD domain-containing protein, G-beta repeat-containing protein n=1 Tax=Glycomyces harbinensis TaxID=58114 RepID=A0A1G6QZS7_9ACTN|nr:WD40 repeat domain-containing protein [Glycomyces harbinensis]SDC97494.1 WD domain-containing protein, G-beta repeat-containing protein [Glycomyces harbinensis]
MASRALVIANRQYTDPGLGEVPSATVDGEALAGVLCDPRSRCGFTTGFLNDVSRGAAARALEPFFVESGPDDLVWLHLACRAVSDERGRWHFAMGDTQSRYPGSTAIAVDLLDEWMTRCPSRRIVLTLDCLWEGGGVDLSAALDGPGRFVITAPVPTENVGGTGASPPVPRTVLTEAIVRGLRTRAADGDRDGYVSARELYDHLAAETGAELAVDTLGRTVFVAAPVDLLGPHAVRPLQPVAGAEAGPGPLAAPVRRRGLLYGGIAAGAAAVAGGGAYALTRRGGSDGKWTLEEVIEPEAALAVTVSHDGKLLAHTRSLLVDVSQGNETVLREFGTWKEIATFPTSYGAELALSPDGGLLVVGTGGEYTHEGFIEVWDTGNGTKTGEWAVEGAVAGAAFRPDGSAFATGGHGEGLVRIWDAATLELIADFDSRIWVSEERPAISMEHLAYTPDGAFIAAGAAFGDFIGIANADTFEPVAGTYVSGELRCIAFSADGSTLAAGAVTDTGDGVVMLYDCTGLDSFELNELNAFNEPTDEVWSLAFSPDGSVLAASDASGAVTLWDTAAYERIASFNVQNTYARFLRFVDNGTLLIARGRLALWTD